MKPGATTRPVASKLDLPMSGAAEMARIFPAMIPDLTGGFWTSESEREFTLEGSWYANEEIQAGADRDTAAAGLSGTRQRKNHTASLQRSRDHRTDLLPLAEGIRRIKTRSSQTTQGTRAGKRQAEAAGGGGVFGGANS